MPQFRAKAVIDAFRIGIDPPPDWFTKAADEGRVRMLPGDEVLIEFDEGTELAGRGDYIINDADEISSLPIEIFEDFYEAA
jgi:hypothetical protein